LYRRLATGIVLAASAAGGGIAEAACPPAVRLAGDDEVLTAEVRATLVERGIGGEIRDCPAVGVSLVRKRGPIVVSIDYGVDGGRVERAVTDARTAATVIEAWVRTDVEAPLLSTREIERPATPAAAQAQPPPPAVAVAPPAAPAAARGVQLFTVTETSFADDCTSWLGAQVGACVTLGPVCAGARARFAMVVYGPAPWQDLDRRGVEMLLAADVPLRAGPITVAPGLGAGVGWIHTHQEGSHAGGETGGLRGEGHVSAAYALRPRLALEVALALVVTQATHVETSSPTPLPDEPRFLGRLGVGLRFGGL